MKLEFRIVIPSPYAIVIPSASFQHSLLDSFRLRFHVSLTPTHISKISEEAWSPNAWHRATVLPKDQTHPPLPQQQDNWNALPSTRESVLLLHLHSTRAVNLTSSHNNGKHSRRLSELIYSDPYRANLLKEKCINLQLRVGKERQSFPQRGI